MERVSFLTYRGRRILFADYSGLQDSDEILRTIETLKQTIGQEPEGSVLLLSNVRDAKTDGAITDAFKELVQHNKPYICASAVVGLGPLQRLVYETVQLFAKREIRTFDDMHKAKDWLVEQAMEKQAAPADTGASVQA